MSLSYSHRRHQEGDAADVRGSLLHPQQQDHPQGHEGRQHPHHTTGETLENLSVGSRNVF